MRKLFIKKKFNPQKYFKKVFVNHIQLKKIYKLGHTLGLHSHSHPTVMSNLDYKNQLKEFNKNKKIFSKILNCSKDNFNTMSHPCGRYDSNTIKVLRKLNIDIGFIATMKDKIRPNIFSYNIPRQDHADIIKKIKKR